MKPKFLPAAIAAAAAGALLAPSARATGNVTYTQGDLLLGFEEPGASNNYVVDLGSPTEFITLSQSGATTNLNTTLGLGNLAADLASSSGFGSGWYTPAAFGSNVQWGVFGAISGFGDSNLPSLQPDTLFETIAETTPGTRSLAPSEHNSSTQDNQSSLFAPFAQAGFNNSSATANSTVATFITASPPVNSPYTSWSANDPSGNAFTLGYGIEQSQNPSNLYIGATNSRLDLYELIPTDEGGTGKAKDLGFFNLTSAGTLDFTGASVPEPSTYASIAFGAAFLLLFRRTRKPMRS
jgi:hypothetical protein